MGWFLPCLQTSDIAFIFSLSTRLDPSVPRAPWKTISTYPRSPLRDGQDANYRERGWRQDMHPRLNTKPSRGDGEEGQKGFSRTLGSPRARQSLAIASAQLVRLARLGWDAADPRRVNSGLAISFCQVFPTATDPRPIPTPLPGTFAGKARRKGRGTRP